MRRTRQFSEIDGIQKYGLRSTLKSGLDPYADDIVYLPEDFDYEVKEVLNEGTSEMYVPESYYFFPISQDEIEKDPNLEQNIDWGGTFDPTLE